MAASEAERSKAVRERKKDSGLVKFEMWTTKENKAILKAFEPEMRLRTIENLTCEFVGGFDGDDC